MRRKEDNIDGKRMRRDMKIWMERFSWRLAMPINNIILMTVNDLCN